MPESLDIDRFSGVFLFRLLLPFLILHWCHSGQTLEDTFEIGNVPEPGPEGDLCNAEVGFVQQCLGATDTVDCQIFIDGESGNGLEHSCQPGATDKKVRGEFVKRTALRQMILKIQCNNLLILPNDAKRLWCWVFRSTRAYFCHRNLAFFGGFSQKCKTSQKGIELAYKILYSTGRKSSCHLRFDQFFLETPRNRRCSIWT